MTNDDLRTTVYRVVDAIELAYLQTNEDYGSNPNRSGKYFATSLAGARAFAGTHERGKQDYQDDVAQSVVNQGFPFVDPGADGAGESLFFGQPQLPLVYGTMTKGEFRLLFLRALNLAAENSESKLARSARRSFVIELNAPGSSGRIVSVDEAVDRIYLGRDSFYRIIDVAIKELLPAKSLAFVRVSGHTPTEFGKTWDPSGLGPFKQIIADEIDDRSVLSG